MATEDGVVTRRVRVIYWLKGGKKVAAELNMGFYQGQMMPNQSPEEYAELKAAAEISLALENRRWKFERPVGTQVLRIFRTEDVEFVEVRAGEDQSVTYDLPE